MESLRKALLEKGFISILLYLVISKHDVKNCLPRVNHLKHLCSPKEILIVAFVRQWIQRCNAVLEH